MKHEKIPHPESLGVGGVHIICLVYTHKYRHRGTVMKHEIHPESLGVGGQSDDGPGKVGHKTSKEDTNQEARQLATVVFPMFRCVVRPPYVLNLHKRVTIL
jgi:hypothetical protein